MLKVGTHVIRVCKDYNYDVGPTFAEFLLFDWDWKQNLLEVKT